MNPTGYREAAAPGLACAWRAALPAGAAGPFVQAVVPDGCVDVVWWERSGLVEVAGPDTGPAPATLRPGDRLAGVRFRPGTAARVLGVPLDALRDARTPLADLWGARGDRLAEALAGAADPATTLAEAMRPGSPDPLLAPLLRELRSGSVRRAAEELGFGERQLRRRTLAAFGYGPKTLQRVMRFQSALRLARAGTPFADVAHATGYADQAHLAHEVRALGGVPLGDLL
ncbi:DUF6597 domain-containing transcriptional factor [Actinomadura parmotrematis]|uniref:Helix-turn-helix domain-containing protein n=1 Tax=Actinomadura parmotrematis TaxID=2864039 RepID=A0ABS7FL57_9ACTN|nr:DUF6597 domain-containing transcriptional factor [Actinomadura parmotrematis]MBW8481091.1 helix-turn-helix domain-containing protein [Actinomadura parmotrematis]